MPKIVHYRDNCIGCNSCVEHAPEYWEIDPSDGKSRLKGGVQKKEPFILLINEIDREQNEEAAKDCPVNIIKIMD